MINRVREVVTRAITSASHKPTSSSSDSLTKTPSETQKLLRQSAVRRKYLSWNAASAAQAEIIEFLEEAIELVKLLVGVNDFRISAINDDDPTTHAGEEHTKEQEGHTAHGAGVDGDERRDELRDGGWIERSMTVRRRRTTSGTAPHSRPDTTAAEDDEVPITLRRIQSRKQEAGARRQRSNSRAMS